MKNSSLIKDTLRQIKTTRARFISIFAIIALGSGFFAGLKSTCPDMVSTAQEYYLEYNLMDLNIKTTMGISENDILALSRMRNVEKVQPGYYTNLFTHGKGDASEIVHIMSINLDELDEEDYINRPRLMEGRLPECENECIVDDKVISSGMYRIGDTMTVWGDSSTDVDTILNRRDFTIVGSVESVLYTSFERGSASIGNGVISFYMFVPEQAFAYEVYTEVFVSFNDTEEFKFNSDEYSALMDEKMESVKNIAGLREVERYDEVVGSAMDELNAAQEEVDKGREQYDAGVAEFEEKIASAEAQIREGQQTVELLQTLYDMLIEIQDRLSRVITDEEEYEKALDRVRDLVGDWLDIDELIEGIDDIGELTEYLEDALATAKRELYLGRSTLNKAREEGQKKLDDAKAELDDAQQQIDDAMAELEKIEKPSWYIFDRSNNPGYATYEEDALRVDNVAKVFPVFFILVAALVITTTMTRMVEDDRMNIGTLKALGYSRRAILLKYLSYASLAGFSGSVFGLCVGFKVFPTIIFAAYRIMYIYPPVIAPFRWALGIGSIIVSLLCTNLSAYFVCRKELNSVPAALMRPKTPKAGKRILLEKIPFIWNRIGFLRKVTIRNLLRYKSRVLMTVIGVAGCTALLFTGFGLQYAISEIVDLQYGEIFTYDLMAVYNSDIPEEEKDDLYTLVENSGYITESTPLMMQSVSASTKELAKREVYLIVTPEKEKLRQFIIFRTRTEHDPVYIEDDGIVVNEKLAKLYKIGIGDTMRISLSDTEYADFKITGICENYTLNYVYMSDKAYEKGFGKEAVLNTFYINMVNTSDESRLATQLLTNKNFLALSFTTAGGAKFRDLVGALNYIVVLIIVCAGALAFVVLYNLANINVTERIREIATIKVLGFHDREVAQYINRENSFSSALGIAAGLFLGIPLEQFVIKTAEVDAVMFVPTVATYCYVYAVILAAFFTFIVNLVMHKKLKQVNMVESLKSVE